MAPYLADTPRSVADFSCSDICLDSYDIHPVTGFLSTPPPLKRLPAYFDPWEDILDNLHQLLVASALRTRVAMLSTLDESRLQGRREWQRAYLVLSFIAHSHIIGVPNIDTIESILPKCIAVPWFAVAKKLAVKPVISYSSVDLNNWYLLNPDGPLDLSNIAIRHTFTGTVDEAWFYLIPLAIEAAGAPSIQALVRAQQAILNKDNATLLSCLTVIADSTEEMASLIKRMYEKCDVNIFWTRFRYYSGGSKNSKVVPNGIFYEGVTEMDEFVNTDTAIPKSLVGTWRRYAGASAGQSPIIHTLDVGLDIHHAVIDCPAKTSLGVPVTHPTSVNPMLEMREYISGLHQDFLHTLANGPSIRDHVASLLPQNNSAAEQFNRAVGNIKAFRDAHIRLTAVYIVLQEKKAAAAAGLTAVSASVGTGGTDLVPFLKQTRNETVDALIPLNTNGC
ncbi:hypothetical protein BASA50_000653 [Batrachochytrium salamandrivorans]|uniref:Indoleamine 2,3-dioxygenase n=1 Tax=Batrachochytrium salamandrivorans TaxID=1357716 RepID=A0ABQ8ETD8_9FUNG|nr:hypothetical protein BASA60_007127 [Batrachochytrium salamandrivorans]KAH6576135.1 hypothetical protein BASA62_001574 [Batrachochytrium salamandrivorans]KAH6579602.1 hypothetical protein BASA61_010118 [Batrachochytrium salamandrivorans]KAH6586188.1 hypothetical protein BASA50_000653 [Batrachochytrium salamandrivorans]KAH9275961.1 hypothetical protein BASA83_001768 [Batrachochytrium salamandrivorans]